MRSNSLALTGLIATVFASSLGCTIVEMVQSEKATRSTEFTVPIPESRLCEIRTENGKIQCIAGDVTEIQVDAQITANASTIEKAEELVESITVDRSEEDGVAKIIANIPRGVSGSVSLTVILPSDMQLKLRSSNGAIEVVGVTDNTAARTSNGSIHLEECAGEIEAKSSNGKITIDGSSLKKVNAATSNGSVHIKGFLSSGNHVVRTSNGSIHVDAFGPPVQIRAKTSMGKIRANGRKVKRGQTVTLGINADDESDESIAHLSLDTSNGSITVTHKQSEADESVVGFDDDDEDGDDEDEDDEDEDDDEDDDEDEDEGTPIGAAIRDVLNDLGI